MAKWRELGEVPDSDEESLYDSEQSQQVQPPPPIPPDAVTKPPAEAAASQDASVWDIPPSSVPSNSPGNEALPGQRRIEIHIPTRSTQQEPVSSPLSFCSTPDFTDDETITPATSSKTNIAEDEHPIVSARPEYVPGDTTEHVSPVEHRDLLPQLDPVSESASQHMPPSTTVEDDQADARPASTSFGRSLRPRKPIQEHPYLLENAQYSTMFKSHGVRPVRLPAVDERRRPQEDDSQEQDYEEDSQSITGALQEDATGDSQEMPQRDLFDDDRDELALSSPPRPSPSPRRRPVSQEPPNSSQIDEELPALGDLFKKRMTGRPRTYGKRTGSPEQSSKRKALKLQKASHVDNYSSPSARPLGIFDIPPSPPQTSPAFSAKTPATKAMKGRFLVESLTPKPSSTDASRDSTPAPAHRQTATTIDLTNLSDVEPEDEAAAQSDGEELSHGHAPSRSPDPEMAMQRRIKGVLPASWIRLDQQISHDKLRKPARRSPERSPERLRRKGVAQRRVASPKFINDVPINFDDSDDEDTNLRNNDFPDILETTEFPIFEDDAGSVIEEDHVDHMLPGRKRASIDRGSRPAVKRLKTQKTFDGRLSVRKRQQRITGLLDRSKSGASRIKNKPAVIVPGPQVQRQRPVARKNVPPRLSILDVVETTAPRFIRVAARAASRRFDKGRSSPTSKHISLGSRQDNIDALGVLQNWRNGKIPSRLPSTAPALYTANALPLQPLSNNLLPQSRKSKAVSKPKSMPVSRFCNSRKLVKQARIDNFVDTGPTSLEAATSIRPEGTEPAALPPMGRLLGRSRTRNTPLRPAQLEAVGNEEVNRQAFHIRKKALDAIYRTSRRLPASDLDTQLEQIFRGQVPKAGLPPPAAMVPGATGTSQATSNRRRARPRKLLRPRHIDTAAPQYTHANDPLPEEHISVPESVHIPGGNDQKLMGLGPYGTNYTQHFEVFPLDDGVFFHDNTLIGQGRITKAFDDRYLDGLLQFRCQSTLVLDGQPLNWGKWDAQTSSEFGVLFDWIADKMQNHVNSIDADAPALVTVVQAADFTVNYLQEVISLPNIESARPFVDRVLEVVSGFLERLEPSTTEHSHDIRQIIEVLTRCMLVVLQTLRICSKLVPSESLQAEELLKKTAKQMIQALLRPELGRTTNLSHELRNPVVRVHGIKQDNYVVVGWVAAIRILQESRIPRSGFWDVTCSVLLEQSISLIVNAQVFEGLWHTFFSILPLGEFDNAGVIVSGLRHTIPLEGWALPQKLLTRVFEMYRTNQRQLPSFNDYCRALVGRCHYLVEQWGWRKCSSIVGTIFDFFASQNLSHLRNEEAYRSARFLEDLAGAPSLAIQTEDRCFHIFLKLLALSIQRLRKFGLIKDVKNLIARVIPNHDRQYLKERDVHENELASLRNHHDLLCTLFWCSPQALRPSVQTLEKLVIPGSSHKEACLINLRAWNQLARFVVSVGEDRAAYKPFADWQSNVFKQVLDQYSSVESDIQQQFLRMSKDASGEVSPELMKRVINMNKHAATDVLHFSLRGNLDVMRHTKSLAAASSVLNTYQLHEVFTRFTLTPPDFDWSTQGVAVEIIDHYIELIHKFLDEHNAMDSRNAWHGEDAILVLDRHVSVPFFAMARSLLINLEQNRSSLIDDEAVYTERTVVVAGRLGALFLRHGVTRLSSFFTTGKYGLFQGLPVKLSCNARRYLCLFVAILIDSDIMDFTSINTTPLELFICAITKPYHALAYEYKFAEALKKQGDICFDYAEVPQNRPDYGTNRDLFDRMLFLMRRALRFAVASQRQQLQQEFSKALRTAMEQIKADLKSLVHHDPIAHAPYMQFVRVIIPLIKKHDFCPVDNFFYQISNEYSPSSQDPRLQTAQILSYGLKLEDGDTRSVSTLFYFLYSNFKLAMTNGKVEQERAILREGMENQHVFSFMLGRLLPAIVRTSVRMPDAWLLLSTYVESIEELLDGLVGAEESSKRCIHREIGEESMGDLLALLKFVSAAINHLSDLTTASVRAEYLQTLTQLIRLLNLFGPSLIAYLCLPRNSMSQVGRGLNKEIDSFTDFTRSADEYLSSVLHLAATGQDTLQVDSQRLFEEMQYYYIDPALDRNEHINNFSKHMESDIQKTWCSDGSMISVKGPPKLSAASTQSGQGTAVPAWSPVAMVQELYIQLKEWNNTFDRSPSTAWKRRAVILDEDILF